MVEIRPAKGVPFSYKHVGIELTTEQRVTPTSTLVATLGTIAASDAVKAYKMFECPRLFVPPSGELYQEALALDVPVLIPLDRSLSPSGYFEQWSALTVHLLTVHVTLGGAEGPEQLYLHTFPIAVKFYDNLPLYRQFNESVTEANVSADNQIMVEMEMPASCVGPQDTVEVRTVVRSNPSNVKRKKGVALKSVSLQLVEIFECHDAGLPRRREMVLFLQTVDKAKAPLTTAGEPTQFQFQLPHHSDELALYEPRSVQDVQAEHVSVSSAAFNRHRILPKLAQGVPFTHVQGFSMQGRFFSLHYELRVTAKTSHKPVQCVLPLTVSPYNRDSCEYIMQWIVCECQKARDRFGRLAVAELVAMHRIDDMFRALRRYCVPPTVYLYSRESLMRLGFNPDVYGSVPTASDYVAYID